MPPIGVSAINYSKSGVGFVSGKHEISSSTRKMHVGYWRHDMETLFFIPWLGVENTSVRMPRSAYVLLLMSQYFADEVRMQLRDPANVTRVWI